MLTYGVEEEVFVTEPERPTLRSLYYLARLMARNPRFYYTHSAHNFARGRDIRQGIMGGVEISTGVHTDVEQLADDLCRRRAELAAVTSGLIVPIGHLLDRDTPTSTCGIHIHIGGAKDPRRLYNNLLHFLPVLPVFTMSSPMVRLRRFGKSYRLHRAWAIGPIGPDWRARFQDLILSRRLGTVELRACDACWDMTRVRLLLRVVRAVAELDVALEPNVQRYNALRSEISRRGLLDETSYLADELRELTDFPPELLIRTPADELYEIYERGGVLAAYSAADNGYRSGVFEPGSVALTRRRSLGTGLIGIVGYFLPRLPYYAWKGLVEQAGFGR